MITQKSESRWNRVRKVSDPLKVSGKDIDPNTRSYARLIAAILEDPEEVILAALLAQAERAGNLNHAESDESSQPRESGSPDGGSPV